MTTERIYRWAKKARKRRIVLQVVDSIDGHWRAEAIDEHGSTVHTEFANDPEQACQNLAGTWDMTKRCGWR